MKNLLAFLLYGTSLAIIACDEAQVETPDNWFCDPVVTVAGTAVEAECPTLFGDGVLASASSCGFVCTPLSGDAQTPPLDMTEPEIEGRTLKVRIRTLEPETEYEIYAYATFGSDRMTSRTVAFATGPASETPEPEPTPDPDPEPESGGYPGWPELPAQETTETIDHYTVTHICADYTYNGVPVTGLRNYTVCYDAATRTAKWSAYPLHACYKGDQGRSNSWAYDPDIPQSLQPVIKEGSYKIPGVTSVAYSRGHFIASNDRTATEAMNKQTFYVTNVAPQWQNGFNGGIWATLEEKCWNNICADTLFVVTGVHFADSSTTVVDNATPPNTVVVPTNFYKVMIRSKAGNTGKPLYELRADELQCIGFWFTNEAHTGANLADFRTTVADIEQKTGRKFFVNVPNATDAVKASNAGTWSF